MLTNFDALLLDKIGPPSCKAVVSLCSRHKALILDGPGLILLVNDAHFVLEQGLICVRQGWLQHTQIVTAPS